MVIPGQRATCASPEGAQLVTLWRPSGNGLFASVQVFSFKGSSQCYE